MGDGNVGKTSLKRTFVGLTIKSDYSATVGADFSIKNHIYSAETEEFTIRYLIYDLAGQPRYNAIRSQYMTGSHASLFVYDVTNRTSFDNMLNWIKQFKQVIKNDVPLILVANKIDLRDKSDKGMISTKEGEKLLEIIKEEHHNKEKNNINYIETSALENLNVDNEFDLISKYLYERYIKDNPYV